MKKLRFFNLLLLLFFCSNTFGQFNSTHCRFFEEYYTTETSYFQFPDDTDVESMSVADILKAKPKVVLNLNQYCIDYQGNLSKRMETLNPDDVFEDWMPQSITSIISKNGSKILDGANNVIFEKPLSQEQYLDIINIENELSQGFNDFPIPTIPTSSEIIDLENAGFTVLEHSSSAIEVVTDSFSIYTNSDNNKIVTTFFEEAVFIKSEERVFYVDENDSSLPSKVVYKDRIELSSGLIGYQVHEIDYYNYLRTSDGTILGKNTSSESIEEKKASANLLNNSNEIELFTKTLISEIQVAPNPAHNNLTIKLPNRVQGQTFLVEIYDLSGEIRKIKRNQSGELKINVSSLSPGIYLIKAVDNESGKMSSKKFIKN